MLFIYFITINFKIEILWSIYYNKAEKNLNDLEIYHKYYENLNNQSVIVDLACGRGRNTRHFFAQRKYKSIYLIDYNSHAIKYCKKKLKNKSNIFYHVNDGLTINLPSNFVTHVHCFDSAVHFSRDTIISYIKEIVRILKKGGQCLLHHSNLGNKASKNIYVNRDWRSNVSKKFVENELKKYNVNYKQILIDWYPYSMHPFKFLHNRNDYYDCITIFTKI